ncbi:hypothetical protein HJC23_010815 [Cyclotella cryptica]|uniref:Tetrapyrrole biosynthesis glutamyl-tRNA reductase dimerisation domain-containing protein n=1 Tax=Cyclotella cryptica TaxID=29204 RepID=A0ABD3QNP9_9STRA|eukprot:CCRYP_003562-RA/>CCRYP_003562-RA protein AED:0.34 eAED:0.34 QI:267/1/1/1/1/1/2/842/548
MVQLFMLTAPTILFGNAFSYTPSSPPVNRIATTVPAQTTKAGSAARTPQNIISSTNRSSSRHSLHLVSLPPKDDTFSLPAESLVRECWKWKDAVLGDGRDYFVPRPKSLRAFHSLFVGMEVCVEVERKEGKEVDERMGYVWNRMTMEFPSLSGGEGSRSRFEIEFPIEQIPAVKQSTVSEYATQKYLIEECVALSNCARFEVILVLKETTQQQCSDSVVLPTNAVSMLAETAARFSVAYHLWKQTQNYRSSNASFLRRTGLASWLDLPDSVDTNTVSYTTITGNATPESSLLMDPTQDITNLSKRLVCIEGTLPISKHLSLIAGGLAPRPNRPARDVIFRPYSSRDAHILLQLKRTVEVVSILDGQSETSAMGEHGKRNAPGGRGRLKILLDGALSAGKAVRNENIVPEIRQLKEFGSDGTPPIGLANVVAEAAIRLGVNPAVENCVARLKALEASNKISLLRQRVDSVVSCLNKDETLSAHKSSEMSHTQSDINAELKKMANELLHAPTVHLRQGEISEVEMETIVQCIESQLKEYYRGLILKKETL